MNAVQSPPGDTVTTSPAIHKSWRPSLVLGLVTFIFHLYVNRGYGIFRDELYFIVCGRHPAFGYVDQPPLVPLLAAATQAAGESLRLRTVRSRDVMPYENDLPIFVARDPRVDIRSISPLLRHYE